jgi:hypothetical protein
VSRRHLGAGLNYDDVAAGNTVEDEQGDAGLSLGEDGGRVPRPPGTTTGKWLARRAAATDSTWVLASAGCFQFGWMMSI